MELFLKQRNWYEWMDERMDGWSAAAAVSGKGLVVLEWMDYKSARVASFRKQCK